MPRFRVIETCNAVVRTTWVLDARSAAEAEKMAGSGDYEAEEDEVYGHQSPEYEVELIKPDPKPKTKGTSKLMAGTLNPCKRCGGRATYTTPEQSGDDEGYHFVGCSDQCGKDPVWAKSKQDVVQKWNAENPKKRRD